MDAVGLKGTFFAITDSPEYPLDVPGWRTAFNNGHECGSHSVSHKKAATLNESTAAFEARESKLRLENHFGKEVTSYCYPYTDAPQFLQNAVSAAGYKQARGGRVARPDKYLIPGEKSNHMNVPCWHINGGVFDHGDVYAYLYAALERKAWTVFMFHSIGPAYQGMWDLVSEEKFHALCRFLDNMKNMGLWTAPFGTVAENLRQTGGF
jgi:peptidoglycan/xylan/chitin deacetylase (PgdA/CDA1 family)